MAEAGVSASAFALCTLTFGAGCGALAAGCGTAGSAEPAAVDRVSAAVLDGYVDERTSGVVGLGAFQGRSLFYGHCTGALIAPNLVLTARHCVSQMDVRDDERVDCSEANLEPLRRPESLVVSPETTRPSSPEDPSYVRGAALHAAPGTDQLCGHDLALMVLERAFESHEATPIVPRIDQSAQPNEVFSAAGYGLTGTSPASSSGVRMRTDDRSVMCIQSTCNAFGLQVQGESEWLSVDANICSGDSGGPALDERGRVMGVASRGPDSCDRAIYTDVAAWGEFIIEVALEAAQAGGYPAPFWTSGSSDVPDGVVMVAQSEQDLDTESLVIEAGPPQTSSEASAEHEACEGCDTEQTPLLAAETGCSVVRRRWALVSPLHPSEGRGGSLGLVLLVGFSLLRRRRRLG